MQGTRTPTATVQERNCITTFVHYCLFLFNLSLHRLLLCTYFYSCVSLLWSGLHENCVDCGYSAEACYPVDLDFTCQIFHRTLFKRNLFIVLEIYGIYSLSSLKLQTFRFVNTSVLVQILHRCCRARWVFRSKVTETFVTW